MSSNRNVYALNAKTGAKQWSYLTGSANDFGTSPAVANGVVYVSTQFSRNLITLNAWTGQKLWGRTGDQTLDSSPTVVNGMIYVGSQDHKVYAFGLK